MKILVITSSPNRHGSSNALAESFIRGAQEAAAKLSGGPFFSKGIPFYRQRKKEQLYCSFFLW